MNINCKKAEEYLVDYLYQELPAKKTLQVEKHLHRCDSCRSTLESWKAIHRAYQRTAEEPQISVYAKQKILAAAEKELSRQPSWSERLLLGLKLATVPLAIFLLVVFLNSKEDPKMAMQKPQVESKTQPPAAQEPKPARVDKPQAFGGRRAQEAPADTRQEARKLDRSEYDEGIASLDEQKREEPETGKDQALSFRDRAEEAPAPATPAAPAASLESRPQKEMEADVTGEKAKMSRISNEVEQPFQQAQSELQRNNLQKGKQLISQAVALDDRKELASQLHQEGAIYQSRGEYVNAIIQFENVQSNYRDYDKMDDVLLRLGDSYAEVGQFGNALQAYSQVRNQKALATERIQRLQKKQQASEQLKALGYVSESPKKEKQ